MIRGLGPLAAGVAAALALAGWHAHTHPGELLTTLADESLLVPLAMRHADPAAFAGDRWLDLAAEVFSVPYSVLVSIFVSWLDDPVHALRVLAIPAHVVFLAFSWVAAGKRGGWALLLLAAAPPFASALGPGMALPRDLVFALVPLFWLAVVAAEDRGTAWWGGTFVVLGVTANLHPLTALHLAALLLLATVRPAHLVADLKRGAVCVAAFLVGAAPYVVQYLTRPATAGVAPEAILEWRVGAIGAESLSAWAARMEPALWAVAAVLALGRLRSDEADDTERLWMRAAWIALGLAAFGPLASRVIDPLRPFQLARLSRFALWFLALVAARRAVGAGDLGREPRRLLFLAAAAGSLLLSGDIGKRLIATLRGGDPQRGPVATVARSLERRLGGEKPFPAAPAGLTRRTAGDPSVDRVAGAREGFLHVCKFARERSEPGDVFLVPPEDWGAFRSYARRPVAVLRKDGGFSLTFLGGRGLAWLTEYREVIAAYDGRGPWAPVLERSGARFVVVEGWVNPPAGWLRVTESGPYAVFRRP